MTNGDDAQASGAGSYASVNGLEIYYEIHGTGEPLVLLHGAYMTIDAMGEVVPSLAKTRRVIAVELQGHGRTADIDRPLSYEQMADDTAALLRHIGIEEANIFGYSMGGRHRPSGHHPAPGGGAQARARLNLLQRRRSLPRGARGHRDYYA